MSKFKFLTFAMMIAIIFVSGCSKNPEDKNFNTVEELNDPKFIIAGQVGAASEPYIGKVFPNAVEKQFANVSDMVVALEQGQVDGIVFTKAMLESVLEEKSDTLRILEPAIGETEIHMAISPNTQLKNLQNEIEEFLKNKKADGTLERLHKYWMLDHKMEMPEIPQIKPPTQKLIVGSTGLTAPSTFYVGEDLRGFDIELIKIFASEYGYEIEFRVEDIVSLLADTEFGKLDVIAGSVMYTDERAERVIFPETPLFTLPISVMARKNPDEKTTAKIEKLSDLNNSKYKIAAVVGAASEPYVGKVFPKAEEKQFSSVNDMIVALEKGQVDGIVFSKALLEIVLEEKPDTFRILETPVGDTEGHMVISPNTQLKNLQNEINEFLKNKKADGTLDKMHQYWIVDHKTEMPDIPQIKPPTQKIIVGTFGTTNPTSFYVGESLTGFDIELIKKFASEYGYEIEFKVEDIISMLADTEFGKVDIISGSVMYTDERAERVIFPETPLYKFPISVMVRKDSVEKVVTKIEKTADLNNSKYKIAAVVGTASEPYVGKVFPNAEEKQFSSINDMVMALEEGQVDGVVYTVSQLESVIQEKPNKFKILSDPLGITKIYMVSSPNTKFQNLKNEIDEFLKNKKADGTLDRLYKYWMVDHKTEMPEIPAPQNPTKKLIAGTLGTTIPTTFYVGEELAGLDIELTKIFAAEYGYEIEYRVEDFTSLLSDAEFGKIDIISGSIMYTDERAERVVFPETPLYELPISVMVRNENIVEEEEEENFLSNLKLSFEKTLIREDRYKMILSGLQVTLILSLGSLVLGTILGFVFCLLKRSNIKIISTAMNLFIVVISGLPIVLTLMICFYIVFSGTGLGEIAIAIIAFSIDFGCYIAITLNSGIESVDAGEIEAAESLGLSKMQIYRKIILPQAVQNIFGVYRRQVISLVKATSIVGYIAVQDLTKVSDIIRARTYDAFFSLLFTAAIYFIIARIFIYILDLADSKLNRRKMNNEN